MVTVRPGNIAAPPIKALTLCANWRRFNLFSFMMTSSIGHVYFSGDYPPHSPPTQDMRSNNQGACWRSESACARMRPTEEHTCHLHTLWPKLLQVHSQRQNGFSISSMRIKIPRH